jgi:hypothetical protein
MRRSRTAALRAARTAFTLVATVVGAYPAATIEPTVLTRLPKLLAVALVFLVVAPTLPGFAEPVTCEKYDDQGICLIWAGGPGVPGPPAEGDPGGGGPSVFTGCASERMSPQPPPPAGFTGTRGFPGTKPFATRMGSRRRGVPLSGDLRL